MPKTYKKPSTILSKAADEVELEEKWVQGALLCAQGKKCAVGAIGYFSGDLVTLSKPTKFQIEWSEQPGSPPDEFGYIDDRTASIGFKYAIAYMANALDPKRFKELYENYTVTCYPYEQVSFDDFVNTESGLLFDVIINKNDNGPRAAARKRIVKAMRKAAEQAKKDGK